MIRLDFIICTEILRSFETFRNCMKGLTDNTLTNDLHSMADMLSTLDDNGVDRTDS